MITHQTKLDYFCCSIIFMTYCADYINMDDSYCSNYYDQSMNDRYASPPTNTDILLTHASDDDIFGDMLQEISACKDYLTER